MCPQVAMLYLQARAKPWHLLVPSLIALGCIVAIGVWPIVTNQATVAITQAISASNSTG